MAELITRLEHAQSSVETLDEVYSNLCCRSIFKELDSYIQYRDVRSGTGKKLRMSKPYWNHELTDLWRSYHLKENEFLKYRGYRHGKETCFSDYKRAQETFDKRKRQIEREFYKSELLKIETICTENPKEFWKCIEKLGQKPNKGIPMKVRVRDNIVTEKTT